MIFPKTTPMAEVESSLVYSNHVSRLEQKEMDRCFTRLFSSEDGKKVLAFLQVMTFHRAAGVNTTDDQLRYMEGQRSMVATILRMIDRGRTQ